MDGYPSSEDPVVYCAEWPDNDFSVRGILMNQTPEFTVENRSDLLYGIELLKTQAQTLEFDKEGRLEAKEVTLSLIPYYAWAHRGAGEMTVWLPIDLNATRPAMPPTIASESEVSASHRSSAISAVNDRLQPQNPEDRSMPYYHWWPKKNTTEWIVYDFKGDRLSLLLPFTGSTTARGVVAGYRKHGRYIIKMKPEHGSR